MISSSALGVNFMFIDHVLLKSRTSCIFCSLTSVFLQDEEEKKRRACIFSYITHLIKFKDLHSMDGVSSAKRHKFPSILRQKFSSMFLSSQAKKLASKENDLLISYVLILTLYADRFQTNLTDIAKDLRMTSVTLRLHYEQLGCKLVRQNNLWFATLPVPLQFPELMQRRRRRQRIIDSFSCK